MAWPVGTAWYSQSGNPGDLGPPAIGEVVVFITGKNQVGRKLRRPIASILSSLESPSSLALEWYALSSRSD